MKDFIRPYVDFFASAAYNLQQTLEGYGLASSLFYIRDETGKITDSYWSPSEAIVLPFLEILGYFVLLLPFLILASYVAARWKGIILLIVLLLLPGALSVLGYWPRFSGIPDGYVVGGLGVLGSPLGIIPLLILGLLTGWTVSILAHDTFALTKRYKDIYDHVWYCLALSTAVFFVANTVQARNSEELTRLNTNFKDASQYLLNQIYDYKEYCQHEIPHSPLACNWASNITHFLNIHAESNPKSVKIFGPESSKAFYRQGTRDLTDQQILEIRVEFQRYNQERCPTRTVNDRVRVLSPDSKSCRVPPARLCSGLKDSGAGLIDEHFIAHRVAIASECIIPMLVREKFLQDKQLELVDEDKRHLHHRWLFFIAFSVLVGGKVANATASALNFPSRVTGDRFRLWNLLRNTVMRFFHLIRFILYTAARILRAFLLRVNTTLLYAKKCLRELTLRMQLLAKLAWERFLDS